MEMIKKANPCRLDNMRKHEPNMELTITRITSLNEAEVNPFFLKSIKRKVHDRRLILKTFIFHVSS